MLISNWNIEWMNKWFVGYNQVSFRQSNPAAGITDVDDLATRVAATIGAIDPDVLMVEEGPSDRAEMELFVAQYLGGNYAVLGGLDGGAQKLFALVRNDGGFTNARVATDAATIRLEEPWESDISGDEVLESYDFTRRPLAITGNDAAGNVLRIVALHTKSKYVHRGRQLWNSTTGRQQFIHEALMNRRRISSEAMRTRQYLDDLLAADANARIVVTGDFNDGPGLDYFESLYLTHNVIDILLGNALYPERIFEHTFIATTPVIDRFTAIFDDYVMDTNQRKILLDHMLISPALDGQVQNSRICHGEYAAQTPNHNGTRQDRVSDHRPVSLELT